MTRLIARLAKLEATQRPELPRCFVLWDNEDYPDDLRPQDLVVCLVRKAESPEAWAKAVRENNPGWFQGGTTP